MIRTEGMTQAAMDNDTPGTLEERLRLTDVGFLNAHALTCEEEGLHKVAEAFRGIAQRADQAADEIASLRARVEAMRETCARIAERDADRSNAVFEAGIGGDAGKDRNAARYRTALRIARAIRDTPVE